MVKTQPQQQKNIASEHTYKIIITEYIIFASAAEGRNNHDATLSLDVNKTEGADEAVNSHDIPHTAPKEFQNKQSHVCYVHNYSIATQLMQST